jgi:glycosyltransferase involved in cell wall biosynthesis
LSVLVPVYKVEPYVRECLESVLGQADAGVEVVVLDDASPDGSMRVVQALRQQWPDRIRVAAHERNRGLS